jgi:hypothetical protein
MVIQRGWPFSFFISGALFTIGVVTDDFISGDQLPGIIIGYNKNILGIALAGV